MDFVIVLLVLVMLAAFISVPLRRSDDVSAQDAERLLATERERQDLEAAREAKYREIRDAELDHSTGKLNDADWEAVDRALRSEAIEILRALDKANDAEKRRRAEVPDDANDTETPHRSEAPGK